MHVVCIYINVCAYACMHACMHACMQQVYIYMNTYVWMHIKPLSALKPNMNNFVKEDSLYQLHP